MKVNIPDPLSVWVVVRPPPTISINKSYWLTCVFSTFQPQPHLQANAFQTQGQDLSKRFQRMRLWRDRPMFGLEGQDMANPRHPNTS